MADRRSRTALLERTRSESSRGLGLKAIERGYRVLFTTAAVLIAALTRALGEGRLDDKLKVYTVPRLLIVDEIGYLPIDRHGANLFFQLIRAIPHSAH
jgi:DNA replication protein DnaC